MDLTDDPPRRWQGGSAWCDRGRRDPRGAGRRVLTVQLEDLTARDRERQFARLVDFLALEDPAPMRAYFDAEISADRAHFGKWRERVSPADARWIDRRYRRLVKRMQRQGIDWVPALE